MDKRNMPSGVMSQPWPVICCLGIILPGKVFCAKNISHAPPYVEKRGFSQVWFQTAGFANRSLSLTDV